MPLSDFIQQIPQQQLIFQLIIPFLIVFAILWGALEALGTFSRRINLILALSFSITSAVTDMFLWFSQYVVNLGTFLALGAFLALFGFGVLRWMLGRGRDIYYESAEPAKRLEKINRKIEKLYEKRRDASPDRQRAIDATIERLEREKKQLREN